jgi:GT2 family glycosyltransferase
VLNDPKCPANVEILVVDDCSPTPLDLPSANGDRVRVLRTPKNLMFSGACNHGAGTATGEVLVFLNNDAIAQPGWLESLLSCLKQNPGVAIVGARLLHRDGTVQHAGVAFSQRDGVPRHVYRGFPGDHPAVVRDRDFQAVTGACMAVYATAFHEAGGFDTGFTNGYEDIDLCMRIRALGHRVRYCAAATLVHHESTSRRKDATQSDATEHSNVRLFMSRWSDAPRDELNVYADDGLLQAGSGDIYPLAISCAPELAFFNDHEGARSLQDLLGIRSRQVFDLQKDVGSLAAQLLDHGIEPKL